ncbi:hypothetical protein BKA93DRAFT_765610 [Sparassis latifolia]
MSQQPETATVVRLSSITPELVARKLRVAGRLFTYIADSSTLLIADGENALFVDVSLCLSPWQSYLWLQENNGTLFALGYLEQVQDPIPLPTLPHHARPTAVDPYLVLSALVVDHVPDLDLELWNSVAERTEQLRLKVEPRDGGSTAVAAAPASTGNPPAIQNVDPLPASKQMPMPGTNDCRLRGLEQSLMIL